DRGDIVRAAQDVSFTVAEGHLFTLLGPSGCGKTTTLRSIAGLERPRAGEISVNGRIVYSSSKGVFVTPNRRGFGMVFQSYAIWPHMNVFQNAAFPLEVGEKRLSRQDIRNKVMKVLTAVQLDHLADREATKLSGGQQQRPRRTARCWCRCVPRTSSSLKRAPRAATSGKAAWTRRCSSANAWTSR